MVPGIRYALPENLPVVSVRGEVKTCCLVHHSYTELVNVQEWNPTGHLFWMRHLQVKTRVTDQRSKLEQEGGLILASRSAAIRDVLIYKGMILQMG